MNALHTVMMYGLAAGMIFFIATITAGIVVGTAVALIRLVQQAFGARDTAPVPTDAEPAAAAF